MDTVALVIIAVMATISGIAAIAVLVDMYQNHKASAV